MVVPRREGLEYAVDHWSRDGAPGWFVVLTNDTGRTFVLATDTDRYAMIMTNCTATFDRYKSLYLDSNYQPLPPYDPRRPSAQDILECAREMETFYK